MIAAAAIASALLACSGDSSGPGNPELNVARVVVQPDSVMLEAGDTQQFRAFAIGLNGDTISGVSFQWFSSDTGLAQVDESGVATAVWEGKAFITAEASGVSGEAVLAVARQKLIAFGSLGFADIYLIRPDGAALRRFWTDTTVEEHPDWSPDGEKILFSRWGQAAVPSSIYSMDIDGSALTNLIPNFALAAHPAWSPDGERIAFRGRQNENDPVEILVMNLATGELTRITHEGVRRPYDRAPAKPRWSPDGTRIVYESSKSGSGDWDIYSINADGTNPVNLTNNPAEDRDPAWSPDGSRIAFSSDRNGNRDGDFDIWVMNADGSEAVSLTNTPSRETQPDWSPDGSKLVFVYGRDRGDFFGWRELYLMNADGSNPTPVPHNSVLSSVGPRWRR